MVLPLRSAQPLIDLAATSRNGALEAAPAMIRIGAPRRIAHELEKRLRAALAAHQLLEGFHTAGTSDPIGPTDAAFQPPNHDAVERRRIAWSLDWTDRVRGAICARHTDGTVACWGERDYLGANQHSERAAPAPIR